MIYKTSHINKFHSDFIYGLKSFTITQPQDLIKLLLDINKSSTFYKVDGFLGPQLIINAVQAYLYDD